MENSAKQSVNYIQHLLGVSDRFTKDDRLSALHISLYYTLFHNWNLSQFRNPISICREEVMQASKIGSANTYTKCLKDLDNWQYLKYMPSFNSHKGSKVYLYTFNKATDKGSDKPTSKGTGKASVKAVIPSINNTNKLNRLNNIKRVNAKIRNSRATKTSNSKKIENEKSKSRSQDSRPAKIQVQKKIAGVPEPVEGPLTTIKSKSTIHPEKAPSEFQVSAPGSGEMELRQSDNGHAEEARAESRRAESRPSRPLLQQVKDFFSQKDWPPVEAEKYFNHYQSNGWLVGGKTPMADWHASAEKWMLNSENFRKPTLELKPGQLNTPQNKNYAEPL